MRNKQLWNVERLLAKRIKKFGDTDTLMQNNGENYMHPVHVSRHSSAAEYTDSCETQRGKWSVYKWSDVTGFAD